MFKLLFYLFSVVIDGDMQGKDRYQILEANFNITGKILSKIKSHRFLNYISMSMLFFHIKVTAIITKFP